MASFVDQHPFFMATSLSSTFVNVYLFKMEEDWVFISMFNLIQYLTTAVTFALGGWLIKKRDRVMAIRLGVAVLSFFYLSVWWLGARSVDWFAALGVILGMGSGFYWLAFHVMYFEITEKENRDIFNGLHGFCTSVGGIVAPFVSGFLISQMGELKGYRLIFGISLIIFLCAVLASFLFPFPKSPGKLSIALGFSFGTGSGYGLVLGEFGHDRPGVSRRGFCFFAWFALFCHCEE